jgi:malate dehydrogenase (oxaloacetate-decarboxylating)
MKDLKKEGLKLHKKTQGKITVSAKVPLKSKKDICLACTLGAAHATEHIKEDRDNVHKVTGKLTTVAVVSDGSHVFGHGNVGSHGALPSVEGKCALISHLANINAVPITLDIQDTHKIVDIVKLINPAFGAIMLEDIEFPKCHTVLERLEKEMKLPVFHNDSQVTATVVLAALINALKVAKKRLGSARIVVIGAGVAGAGIARLLRSAGVKNLIVCDIRGPIYKKRPNMNVGTNRLVDDLKLAKVSGKTKDAVKKADVVIGVSQKGHITDEMIGNMAKDPIVFALSRPDAEVNIKEAKAAGAKVVATGLFEKENHIDNAILFPGLARAIALHRVHDISDELFIELAKALAGMIKKPTAKDLLPDVFDKKLLKIIEDIVKKYAPKPRVKKKKKKKPAKKAKKKTAKKVKKVKKVTKKKAVKKKTVKKKVAKKPAKKKVTKKKPAKKKPAKKKKGKK